MYNMVSYTMFGVVQTNLVRVADSANIPQDPNNKDYQEYLAWIALGNTATPVTLG